MFILDGNYNIPHHQDLKKKNTFLANNTHYKIWKRKRNYIEKKNLLQHLLSLKKTLLSHTIVVQKHFKVSKSNRDCFQVFGYLEKVDVHISLKHSISFRIIAQFTLTPNDN